MTKLCSMLRLSALTACASAMLIACASSPVRDPAAADPSAVDPKAVAQDQVVQHQVQTRLVCPAELDQVAPAKPQPAADAVISHNDSGGAFLAALNGWGEQLLALFNDAKADCAAEKGVQ